MELCIQRHERIARDGVVDGRRALGPRGGLATVGTARMNGALHIGAVEVVGDKLSERHTVERDRRHVLERAVAGAKVLPRARVCVRLVRSQPSRGVDANLIQVLWGRRE